MKKIISLLIILAISAFISTSSFSGHHEKAVGYFGWFGVGKVYQLGEGKLYWIGEFSGSFRSDDGGFFHKASVRCPAANRVDLVNGTTSVDGVCIIKDPDGDEAYLEFDLPNGTLGVANRGTYYYTGGTGKYEGLSGDGGYFYGHIVTNWPDGTAGGYSTWNKEP